MLKSRRGLLAAGLAVAVVGAIGVASTLNAGAEQVPGDQPQAPVADQAQSTQEVSTPPATLPWGAKPQRAHRGRMGTSSKELRADGLQSAPDDNTHHLDFAPKGRSSRSGFLKSEVTDIQPPAPAASASATSTTAPATTAPTTAPVTVPATTSAATTAPATQATTTSPAPAPAQPLAATTDPTANTSPAPTSSGGNSTSKVNFLYSVGSEETTADGVYVSMDVRRPTLANGDFHTLAELAVQSDDTSQTIEVGWTVDRSVNGDDDPHLFVFHWVNNQPTCYNTCGRFVPYKGGVAPGDTLPTGNLKKFGIQHNDGAWWISYDTTFVGYFLDKEWSGQGADFTQGGYFQVFGEVAAASTSPCTQMGSGSPSTDDANAARIGNMTYVNGPVDANGQPLPPNLYMRSTNGTYGMSPVKESTRAFRYGGPLVKKASCG